MSINSIRNFIGGTVRKVIVWRYKLLGVEIGRSVFISHKAKIDTTYRNRISIGDFCYITYGAIILSHDHSVYRHTPIANDDGKRKVVLAENVFVGANAIILGNVKIGRNSVVSAGAVVTKDVPENVIVAGNPARIIRHFNMKDQLL